MRRILFFSLGTAAIAVLASCGGSKDPNSANGDTPTEAYKRLFAAVKAKDVEAIQAQMTRRTVEKARASAKQWGKTEDAVLEHGMVASTFADELPPIRDERVKDNMGAVEVWNSKESTWEDLPFMIEDGSWKLAIGDLFAGSFKFPGKGRNTMDKEASNALSNAPNVNSHPAASK